MSIPEERYVDITRPGETSGGANSGEVRDLKRRLDQHIGSGGQAHAVATETAAGFMSSDDKQKLNGIQNEATKNMPDDYLLARGNHTGVQAIETINGLREELNELGGAELEALVAQAEDAADEAEAARDAAFVNADVYPDVASGLAAVADGEQFQVVEGDEIVRYRRDSETTVIEVARISGPQITSALAQNARISEFSSREEITDDGLRGPELIDETPNTTITTTIVGGVLAVAAGSNNSLARYWWEGHARKPGQAVIVRAKYRRSADEGESRAIIAIGSGAAARQVVYVTNGLVALADADNSAISSITASAASGGNMDVAAEEEFQVSLFCGADGGGWILAENQSGNRLIHSVSGIPSGLIRFGWRSSAGGEILGFSVEYRDAVSNIPDPAALAISNRSKNVLPSDFLADIEFVSSFVDGWSSVSPGDPQIVDFNNRKAVRITASLRTQVEIPATATEMAYFLRLDEFGGLSAATTFTPTRGLFIAFRSGSTVIDRVERSFYRSEPGHHIEGVVAIPTGADNIIIAIDPAAAQATVSHASVAFSDVGGFRPSMKGGEEKGPLAFLDWSLVPDFPGGGDIKGHTCTGLDRISRGKFAGCWLGANDGRFMDGSSGYNPHVHVITPDWRTILASFPMPYVSSAQGVAVDTSGEDDTFWVATAGDMRVRHFHLYGEDAGQEISDDVIDWTELGYASQPNGLAYDPDNDALWAGQISGGEARLLACDPAVSPRLLSSITMASSPDQFYYDSEEKVIYATYGANESNGFIVTYDTVTGKGSRYAEDLPYAQSIEGIYVDKAAGILTLTNDGGFHIRTQPEFNIAIRYRIL